jgi:hypothetical protein
MMCKISSATQSPVFSVSLHRIQATLFAGFQGKKLLQKTKKKKKIRLKRRVPRYG